MKLVAVFMIYKILFMGVCVCVCVCVCFVHLLVWIVQSLFLSPETHATSPVKYGNFILCSGN